MIRCYHRSFHQTNVQRVGVREEIKIRVPDDPMPVLLYF
jgi:hypothetical protein